jgi:hypothetical protein
LAEWKADQLIVPHVLLRGEEGKAVPGILLIIDYHGRNISLLFSQAFKP